MNEWSTINRQAMQYLNNLKSERGGQCKSEVLEENSISKEHTFWQSLTGEDEEVEDEVDQPTVTVLTKLVLISKVL